MFWFVTKLLKEAFDKASQEMSESEQDEFARWLLEAIESDERRWDTAFARSGDKLHRLASRALRDSREGHTEPLDPEKL